ncbi:MAG: HAD-IIIA family hydrolase [Bacteroidales bacterium]|nr:HAD-IIIA family hydrolase [Bacteroidales bacterium]
MKAFLITVKKENETSVLIKKTSPSMVRIGGIPILHHQIKLFRKYNINTVYIPDNQYRQEIESYFGKGKDFGVQIDYLHSNHSFESRGDENRENIILIHEGMMINMNLERLVSFHNKKESDCTLVTHPVDKPFHSKLVELDIESRVIQYIKKPLHPGKYFPNMAYAGICVLSSSTLNSFFIEKNLPIDENIFSNSINPKKIFGYNTSEYVKDIATMDDLKQVEYDYQTGKITSANFEFKQKAIFLDRDGVINKETGYISKPEDISLYDFSARAIKKLNSSEYKSILITNQSSIARGLITLGDLKSIHNKLETSLIQEGAKLDAIYFCPHHPDRNLPGTRSEYIADCMCRKPKPGLLLDAAFHFNIDLSSSFMIGDSERDIQAGINAGCTTSGVMTGYGLRNTTIVPDFFFANLQEAVDFIVDEPYKDIYKKLSGKQIRTPCIILIGGLNRSGKSILASYLKWKIEQDGKKAFIIRLDNWSLNMKNSTRLTEGFTAYQIEKAEMDLQQILIGISTKKTGYTDYNKSNPIEIAYHYKGEEYILIEGAFALSSKTLRDLSHIKIFLDIPEIVQKKRLIQMMEWQGTEVQNFSDIYKKIKRSEIKDIKPGKKFANIIK